MRDFTFFLFIVLIPAFIALGHDFYLFYETYGFNFPMHEIEERVEQKGYMTFFASLGFIWTQYHPDSLKELAQTVEPETLSQIKAVLKMQAVTIGLLFAAFCSVLWVAIKALRGTLGGSKIPQSKTAVKFKRK